MSDERQFTATTQDGIPGHCFCAQVFDPDGNSIAALEPTDEPAIANQRAQWLADACNAHPADGDELVDENFLRECGFKLLIFPVFTLGNPLIDVEIHLGKRTAKVGTVEIKFPATRSQLRSLLAALGVNK